MNFSFKKVLILMLVTFGGLSGVAKANFKYPEMPLLISAIEKEMIPICADECHAKHMFSLGADSNYISIIVAGVKDIKVARRMINSVFKIIEEQKSTTAIKFTIFSNTNQDVEYFWQSKTRLIEFTFNGE
jgi:hypothetical protein